MHTRAERNRDFYGRPMTAQQLLLPSPGTRCTLAPTAAARCLFAALDDLLLLTSKPQQAVRCACWQIPSEPAHAACLAQGKHSLASQAIKVCWCRQLEAAPAPEAADPHEVDASEQQTHEAQHRSAHATARAQPSAPDLRQSFSHDSQVGLAGLRGSGLYPSLHGQQVNAAGWRSGMLQEPARADSDDEQSCIGGVGLFE